MNFPAVKIVWKPEEWDQIAKALVAAHPDKNLLIPGNVATLHIDEVNAVMQSELPADRHRRLDDMWKVKKMLEETFNRLARLAQPADYDAALIDPPSELAEDEEAQQAAANAKRRASIQWTPNEWYAIAAEIHRRNPHAKYPDQSNLSGIRLIDVKEAMRVLPRERQRDALNTVTPCRPYLLEAFKIVREDIAIDAQRKAEAKQREEDAKARAETEAAQRALDEANAKIAEMAAQAAQKTPLESLFHQLGAHIGGTFAEGFINVFIEKFKTAVATDLPGILNGQSAPAVAAAPAPVSASVTPIKPEAQPEPAKPARTPHIVIVGPLPQQANEIKKCYPQVKFSIYSGPDSGIKDAAKHCDRAIGMTRFMSHPLEAQLMKAAGDRYTRVAHGVSDIKRQLDVWMHTGVIPPKPDARMAA